MAVITRRDNGDTIACSDKSRDVFEATPDASTPYAEAVGAVRNATGYKYNKATIAQCWRLLSARGLVKIEMSGDEKTIRRADAPASKGAEG